MSFSHVPCLQLPHCHEAALHCHIDSRGRDRVAHAASRAAAATAVQCRAAGRGGRGDGGGCTHRTTGCPASQCSSGGARRQPGSRAARCAAMGGAAFSLRPAGPAVHPGAPPAGGAGAPGVDRQRSLVWSPHHLAPAVPFPHRRRRRRTWRRRTKPLPPHLSTLPRPPALPAQVLWTFSVLLETVAALPQLLLMERCSCDRLTVVYVAMLGCGRVLGAGGGGQNPQAHAWACYIPGVLRSSGAAPAILPLVGAFLRLGACSDHHKSCAAPLHAAPTAPSPWPAGPGA